MAQQQRVDFILRASGIPIHGVAPSGDSFRVDFTEEATSDQRALASSILANLDLTDSALLQWENQLHRQKSKSALVSDGPIEKAVRNSLKVLFASLVETRAAVNRIRNYLANMPAANTGQLPASLVNRSWDQAVEATRQQIEAE